MVLSHLHVLTICRSFNFFRSPLLKSWTAHICSSNIVGSEIGNRAKGLEVSSGGTKIYVFRATFLDMPKNRKSKHKSVVGAGCVKPKSNGMKSSRSKSDGIITVPEYYSNNLKSSAIPPLQDAAKKKPVRRKKKQSLDSVSQMTASFAKLDVKSQSTKSSKKATINQPHTVPARHHSHSAGGNRSTGNKIETLEDVARYIKVGRAKNIVVMCGAGISTASGIPDFRTPGTGLYHNLQKYNIPTPEAVFDLDYFHYKPKPFFELAKELYPTGKYRPNLAHYFLRSLHEKGLLLRLYTQNIDGLERLAGIPPSKLVEAHGTFATASCTKCGRKYDGDKIKEKIFKNIIPRCDTPLCWAVVKPDIVFFGEDLPKRFYYYLKDFPICDLLIVMGTSLEVEPFASLVDSVRYNVPRLLINRDVVGPFKKHKRKNMDAIGAGDMVDVVGRFTTLLGWKRFVEDTMTNHEKLFEMEASSDVQTDSGVSSASSENEQKLPKKSELLPPPSGNIKRYFHTIRSTPLPKSKSSLSATDGESSAVPHSLSYFEYIRSTVKPSGQSSVSTKEESKPSAKQLLDKYTFEKGKTPRIQYAFKVATPNSKIRSNTRKFSCASLPCRQLDIDSSDSQSESSSSNTSTDS